jgi:cytochrome c
MKLSHATFFVGMIALLPLTIAAAQPVAAGPAGETLFKQRCAACHGVKAGAPSVVGPNLAGLSGRKAGAAKFNYTPALKASKIVWTKQNLDKFLAAPSKMVPGTRMMISISDPAQRAAVASYLSTLK